jgi:hypothetical protein
VTLRPSANLKVNPRELSLSQFDAEEISVELMITHPFKKKGGALIPKKETIMIKSDYFDQKVNVTIIPLDRGRED